MRKMAVIFLTAAICAFFAPAISCAAEKKGGAEKDEKQEGAIKGILTMPVKMIKPILTGGAGEAAKKKPEAEKVKSMKDMTPAELAGDIKETLGNNDEILPFIPELKKEKDRSGNVIYTYQGVSLDSLDRDRLERLFGRVRNELVRLRTERMTRQMANIKRAQNIHAGGNARTPGVSRIPQTPRIPRIPPRPTTIPKPLPRIPQAVKRVPNL